MGAYSRWALIRGWAVIKFSPFSAISVVFLLYKKTVKASKKKREKVTKQNFLGTRENTPSLGKSLISTYSISVSISLLLK